MKSNGYLILLILTVSIGLSISLACDLIYFVYYHGSFAGINYTFAASGMLYPLVFATCDLAAFITNKTVGVVTGIVFVVADGVFSFSIYFAAKIAVGYSASPDLEPITNAISTIAPRLIDLWLYGCVAQIITIIFEIVVFASIIKRFNHFALAVIISTALTLFIHNIVLDYMMLKDYTDHWKIILGNYSMNIIMVSIYATIIAVAVKKMSKSKSDNGLSLT